MMRAALAAATLRVLGSAAAAAAASGGLVRTEQSARAPTCSCADTTLCAPLATPLAAKEIVAFEPPSNYNTWLGWGTVITVLLFGPAGRSMGRSTSIPAPEQAGSWPACEFQDFLRVANAKGVRVMSANLPSLPCATATSLCFDDSAVSVFPSSEGFPLDLDGISLGIEWYHLADPRDSVDHDDLDGGAAELWDAFRLFSATPIAPLPAKLDDDDMSVALPAHPRLRLNEAGVRRIREATGPTGDPLARQLLENITAHVAELLNEPIPAGGMNGSHGATGLLCDTIRDHVYSFGLLYRLSTNTTERGALAARAAAEMVAVAALDNWNPRRFLTVAETMHSLAIGYDWFFHVLSTAQRTAIEDGIYRNGLAVGMDCYAANCTWVPGIAGIGKCSTCWWIRATKMNWNVVGNGGMAIAALALGDVPRYANIAKSTLQFSAQGIPAALVGYAPDGAWPEGPGYWCYITKNLLAVSEALATATGTDEGYMESPGVMETTLYAVQTHRTPSNAVDNYGDAEDETATSGVAEPSKDIARYSGNLLGLAARFPQLGLAPVVAARAALRGPPSKMNRSVSGSWDDLVLSLMHWDSRGNEQSLNELPNSTFYSSQAVAVLRSGWEHSRGAYLAAKGGDSSITHQDLDHGHFVYDTRGFRWFCDLGSESYALPNMFLPFGNGTEEHPQTGRYQYYRKATRGHNTLAFDDPGGFNPANGERSDQSVNIMSTLVRGAACAGRTTCDDGEAIIVNLTSAYAAQLGSDVSVMRTFSTASRLTSVTTRDEIAGRQSKTVTWGAHTRASVSLHGGSATLTSPGGLQLRMTFESTPLDACGNWQTALVKLPGGTEPNNTRFPLRGARKIWLVCKSTLKVLSVTMHDSGTSSSPRAVRDMMVQPVSTHPAARVHSAKTDDTTTMGKNLTTASPDLIARFEPSALSGPSARPATRACAGLLNGGPEFGAKFIDPLRMGNYRGNACNDPTAYSAMVTAGATNVQCDVQHWLNCTTLPMNLSDTSMCAIWPGRDGDWTAYEKMVAGLVAKKAGPMTSWGVINVCANGNVFAPTMHAESFALASPFRNPTTCSGLAVRTAAHCRTHRSLRCGAARC